MEEERPFTMRVLKGENAPDVAGQIAAMAAQVQTALQTLTDTRFAHLREQTTEKLIHFGILSRETDALVALPVNVPEGEDAASGKKALGFLMRHLDRQMLELFSDMLVDVMAELKEGVEVLHTQFKAHASEIEQHNGALLRLIDKPQQDENMPDEAFLLREVFDELGQTISTNRAALAEEYGWEKLAVLEEQVAAQKERFDRKEDAGRSMRQVHDCVGVLADLFDRTMALEDALAKENRRGK